jgi:hypothetical protein
VKQSFEKLVGETKRLGDENTDVAARIVERHGADVHLPSSDGGTGTPQPFYPIGMLGGSPDG